MNRGVAALLLLALLTLATTAVAGPREGSASFSVNAGTMIFDNDEKLDDGPVIGGRLGYDLNKYLGIEGSFSWVDTRSNASTAKPQAYAYLYRADLLYYILPESSFVPFLTVGGGVMQLNGSEKYGNRTSQLLEYGLGANYFLSDNLALRADARQILSFDNNRHVDMEFTGGINYYFNRGAKPALPQEAAAAPQPVVQAAPVAAPVITAAPVVKPAPAPTPSPVVVPPPPAAAPAPAAKATPVVVPVATAPPVVKPVPAPVPAPKPAAAPTPAAPAPAAPACSSQALVSKIIAEKNAVEIVAKGKLAEPRVFTLTGPARLAIDIDCAANGTGTTELPINGKWLTKTRLGDHPDKLRITFDFKREAIPAYRVVRTANGLMVFFTPAPKK